MLPGMMIEADACRTTSGFQIDQYKAVVRACIAVTCVGASEVSRFELITRDGCRSSSVVLLQAEAKCDFRSLSELQSYILT